MRAALSLFIVGAALVAVPLAVSILAHCGECPEVSMAADRALAVGLVAGAAIMGWTMDALIATARRAARRMGGAR